MFNLLRYFSLTSAAAIVVIAVAMQATYKQGAVRDLTAMAERHNVALARSFANTLWARYATYVTSVSGVTGDELRANPITEKIHQDFTALTEGLPVLKVKIYSFDGLTVYSSEPGQMGDDKSGNQGFLQAAHAGVPASKMSYRDTFSAFSGVVEGRDLVETYIPIRGADGQIEAVFELYTDVTPLVKRIGENSVLFIIGLLVAFGLLYGILFLIVRHADQVLNRQYLSLEHEVGERKRVEGELREAHETLERRVEERTAELRENEQKLVVARDEARAADRAKSEFLAAISHELRTPLNAVIGFSEVIKDEALGPIGNSRYREYSDDIHASGQRLLGLINDVLDLSKIESGTDELYEEQIIVPDVVHSALTMMGQRVEECGLDLELDLSPTLPSLYADARKVKQILVNLLSNAVKFTEPGGKIALTAWADRGDGYVFEIIDNGIGIAPDDLSQALERFGQIDGGLDRKYEGTGLGLPLSKALVEQHGGSLELQSDVGVGTTVTVRFPAERIVALSENAAPPSDRDKLRVG